jgi:cysteine synthase A
MQGWSPDFVSSLTEKAIGEGPVDEIVPVQGNDALRLARELATKEGIFVGTSSGATLAAALDVARRAPPGSNVVCMLPDTGERYLSTPLFDGIDVDMNEAELEISRSTPGYRFDASAPPAAPVAIRQPDPVIVLDASAEALVAHAIRDHAVVMFALEWCDSAGRCASCSPGSASPTRRRHRLGRAAGRHMGTDRACTGSPTIPQIYIGATHVGGCIDLFDAMRAGRMRQLLEDAGVEYDRAADVDPYGFLPKWLHPRKTA